MPRFAIKTHNGLSRRLLLQDPQAIANVTSPNRAFDLRWNSEFVHTYLL
jgi:hypothetical protein